MTTYHKSAVPRRRQVLRWQMMACLAVALMMLSFDASAAPVVLIVDAIMAAVVSAVCSSTAAVAVAAAAAVGVTAMAAIGIQNQIQASQANSNANPSPQPQKKDSKDESCFTLGRQASGKTNISSADLKYYPDPKEQFTDFYVQWAAQSELVDPEGSLVPYMQRKIQEDFPGSSFARLIPLTAEPTKPLWVARMNSPVTLAQFSEMVDGALRNDSFPKIWGSNDPKADYYRHTRCQYEIIEPIRVPQPNFGFKINSNLKVNYNDPSLLSSPQESVFDPINSINQKEIDISQPEYRSGTVLLQDTDASDILVMHRLFKANYNSPKLELVRNVKIALIDSGWVGAVNGGPKFNIVRSVDPINNDKFSHAMEVASRLAAPSDDGKSVAGTIPDLVLQKANVNIYSRSYSVKWKFSENFTINGSRGFDTDDVIYWLSGGTLYDLPWCFQWLSCFTNPIPNIADSERPDIISDSLSVRLEASSVRDIFRGNPRNISQVEKIKCLGNARRKLLEGRPWKIPIVQAGGNDPKTIAGEVVDCDDHVIGVAGTDLLHPYSLPPESVDSAADASQYNDVPWRMVGMVFLAPVPHSPTDANAFDVVEGTSFSAPTVAGIMATSFSLMPPSSEPFTAQGWEKTFDEGTRQFVTINSEVTNIPFLNAACYFQWFALNRAGLPLFNEYILPDHRGNNICNI